MELDEFTIPIDTKECIVAGVKASDLVPSTAGGKQPRGFGFMILGLKRFSLSSDRLASPNESVPDSADIPGNTSDVPLDSAHPVPLLMANNSSLKAIQKSDSAGKLFHDIANKRSAGPPESPENDIKRSDSAGKLLFGPTKIDGRARSCSTPRQSPKFKHKKESTPTAVFEAAPCISGRERSGLAPLQRKLTEGGSGGFLQKLKNISRAENSAPPTSDLIKANHHGSTPIESGGEEKRNNSGSGSQFLINRSIPKSSSQEAEGDLPSTPAMKRKIGNFLKTHFPEEQQRTDSPIKLKGILASLENSTDDRAENDFQCHGQDLVHKEVMVPIHPKRHLRLFDFLHHDHDSNLEHTELRRPSRDVGDSSLNRSNIQKKHFHLFEHLLHRSDSKKHDNDVMEELPVNTVEPVIASNNHSSRRHITVEPGQYHDHNEDTMKLSHFLHESSAHSERSEHNTQHENDHSHDMHSQRKHFPHFSDGESHSHRKELSAKLFDHIFHSHRHEDDLNSPNHNHGIGSISPASVSPSTPTFQAESPPMNMSAHDLAADRSDSVVAAPESSESQHWHLPKFHFKRPRATSQSGGNESTSSSNSETLAEKYGKKDAVIGKGAYAKVRVIHKPEKNARWYAVKEFRKKKKEENEKDYVKKVIAEFCISSSLRHPNVVEYIDLIKDENGRWCEVMEYCAGGDLLHKIQAIGLSGNDEAYCLFKQLINGISYIHSVGVVHRDLKPENILLDYTHRFVKITDFGVATVFRTQWEKAPHLVHGIAGSAPYIAPEEWTEDKDYLPTKVDIWACGMIFYAMLGKGMLWASAQGSDVNYSKYLRKRETGYPPFEIQDPDPKRLLYLLMDPDPKGRPEALQLLEDTWLKSAVSMCVPMLSADAIAYEHNPSFTHVHLTCPPPLNHH